MTSASKVTRVQKYIRDCSADKISVTDRYRYINEKYSSIVEVKYLVWLTIVQSAKRWHDNAAGHLCSSTLNQIFIVDLTNIIQNYNRCYSKSECDIFNNLYKCRSESVIGAIEDLSGETRQLNNYSKINETCHIDVFTWRQYDFRILMQTQQSIAVLTTPTRKHFRDLFEIPIVSIKPEERRPRYHLSGTRRLYN